MAIRQILATYWEGLSTDDKPTGVAKRTTFRETDTHALYISYDGTVWVVASERVRITNENGSFLDLPGEVADIITVIEGI